MNLSRLPDDVNALKEIIHFQMASYREIESKKSALESELTTLRGRYDFLEEQLRLLKSSIYARKSEKYSGEEGLQACLFNEAEEALQAAPPESEKTEEITVAAHQRGSQSGGQVLNLDVACYIKIQDLTPSRL